MSAIAESSAGRPRGIVVNVRAARGLGRHRSLLRNAARRALGFLDESPCELSIALVDDRAIRDLNRAYRGIDRPTDVLSFAQREGGAVLARELLGDVVLSFETADRQAERRNVAVEHELRHLLVHGILHLLGYDHERSRSEARRMFAKARAVEGELERSAGPAAGRSRVPLGRTAPRDQSSRRRGTGAPAELARRRRAGGP